MARTPTRPLPVSSGRTSPREGVGQRGVFERRRGSASRSPTRMVAPVASARPAAESLRKAPNTLDPTTASVPSSAWSTSPACSARSAALINVTARSSLTSSGSSPPRARWISRRASSRPPRSRPWSTRRPRAIPTTSGAMSETKASSVGGVRPPRSIMGKAWRPWQKPAMRPTSPAAEEPERKAAQAAGAT